jgi:hypothetical protein
VVVERIAWDGVIGGSAEFGQTVGEVMTLR